MKNDNLSHEEVWDDSALQNSWDDALTEYKKYHSMAAKGEQVDISELAETEQVKPDPKPTTEVQQALPANGTSHANVQPAQTVAGAASSKKPTATGPSTTTTPAVAAVTAGTAVPGSTMPQALLNTGKSLFSPKPSDNEGLNMITVQDEALKNLMMSWYYAGYYTGLLEGQQKAFASMQEGG